MLEPWNDSSILPPPVNMFRCSKKIDLCTLRHVCNNIIKVLLKQSPLHRESALCSRFIYKYDTKFRNDIGYRNFRKVHTALKKYLSLNLVKDVESFISALPSSNDDEQYLPTRQMLEYLMLRIITFSKIMLRVSICSKQASVFYLNRIRRGESHWMSLLPYALLSRLWSISMVLVQHSSAWYTSLYPYLSNLELKGLNLLPNDYELPQDLEKWLDLKNVDCFGKFDWDQKKLIEVDNILLDDDDNDLFDNILHFVNQSHNSEQEIGEEFKPMLKGFKDDFSSATEVVKIDQGEILSREIFKMGQGEAISRESFRMEQAEVFTTNDTKNDQGEALSRESFKVLLNTKGNPNKGNLRHGKTIDEINRNIQKSVQQKDIHKITKQSKHELKEVNNIVTDNSNHSHNNVTNTTSLKVFIDKEDMFRNESDKRSLTDHLSFMQWLSLKNSLLKLCDSAANRKIGHKFQKIWKQKCLDYK